jgi:cytidylate kinase
MCGRRIALIGKSGAGKSEVSRHLAKVHGFTAIRTGAICRTIAKLLFNNEDKATTQLLDDALTALDPSIRLKGAAS